jgi:hypothetical protein
VEKNQSNAIPFIIKALADDYESIETLVNYYTESQPDVPSFSRSEVTQALTELIDTGYVQPYSYSDVDRKLVPSEFSPSSAGIYWFGLTGEGKELLSRLNKKD